MPTIDEEGTELPPALYVVSTPIGHLGDLSKRALEILRLAHLIVCEDTRVTTKLLRAYGLERPMASHHAHSNARSLESLLSRLNNGDSLALVSDAGTPLVSDPGSELVGAALDAGHAVVPVPGASALLTALVASGLPSHPFVFLGFLPRGGRAQREAIGPYIGLPLTLVIYEAPGRIHETLRVLAEAGGQQRRACVARELTKRFETIERGTLSELMSRFEKPTRGELVIVVGPPGRESSEEAPPSAESIIGQARELLAAGTTPSEAAKLLAAARGLPKKVAYQAVMQAKTLKAP